MKITPQQYRKLCPMRKVRRHIRRAAQRTNKKLKIGSARATLKLYSPLSNYKGINILRCRIKNRSAYIPTAAYSKAVSNL